MLGKGEEKTLAIANMIDLHTTSMITCHQEVPSKMRFTISLPDECSFLIEKLMKKWETSRSGVFAELLRQYREQEMEQLLAEGYKAMAQESQLNANSSFAAQAEVVLSDTPSPR